ncbi:Zinc finger, RING-type [Dillenia turbinata]|uniref:Zinc finger, RING-type n=1 Tax=Dillenia turbinata TaxID=194707 RepID=A0AAN8V4M3_9MAGN
MDTRKFEDAFMDRRLKEYPDGLQASQSTEHLDKIQAISITAALSVILLLVLCYKLLRRRSSDSSDSADNRTTTTTTTTLNDELENIPVTVCGEDDGLAAVEDCCCAICLAEFVCGEILRVVPRCKHVYHKECVDAWLMKCPRCPICRDLVIDDRHVEPNQRRNCSAAVNEPSIWYRGPTGIIYDFAGRTGNRILRS